MVHGSREEASAGARIINSSYLKLRVDNNSCTPALPCFPFLWNGHHLHFSVIMGLVFLSMYKFKCTLILLYMDETLMQRNCSIMSYDQ